MFIMEYSVRPALRSRDRKRAPGSAVPASDVLLKEMWLLIATGKGAENNASPIVMSELTCAGLTIFLGGYLIWHLDNLYCDSVRRWRHYLQLPWAVVLEGHAVSITFSHPQDLKT